MLRIKAEDGAGSDPVTGKNIYVERLAPQISTYMRPYWANAVQEEIANTIEADGTVLNEADNKQLLRAVKFPHAIRTNLTLVYGTDFVNLNQAFDLLRGRYIAPGVMVTISLGAGYLHDITITEPVIIDHPQGSQIYILGDIVNPENVIMRFVSTNIPHNRGAIEIASGCSIGGMNGFRISETYVYNTDNRFFIKVNRNASLILGDAVTLSNISGCGVYAEAHSFVDMKGCTVRLIATVPGYPKKSGFGVYAENKAVIVASGMVMNDSTTVGQWGIYATGGCSVRVESCNFNNFFPYITNGSHIDAYSSNFYSGTLGRCCTTINSTGYFDSCSAGGSGTGNNASGFSIQDSSSVTMRETTSSYNYIGFSVSNSRLNLYNCNANNNTTYGYQVNVASNVGLATGTGNGSGLKNVFDSNVYP